MKFEITGELVNALIEYLATRPYGEVFRFIAALTQLTKIEEK